MTMIEGGRRRRRRRRRGRGRWGGIGWGRRGRWGWGTVVTAVTTTKSWRISTARVNQRRRSHFASVTTLAIYRRLKGGATGKTPKEKEKKGKSNFLGNPNSSIESRWSQHRCDNDPQRRKRPVPCGES